MGTQKSKTKAKEKKENNDEVKIENKTQRQYLKNMLYKHKKDIILSILSVAIGIIITPYISPTLAIIFPFIDKEPPEIIEVTPLTNSNIFNLSNISVEVSDSGGSGLDLESSYLMLSGAYSRKINVTKKITENVLIFTPIEELKPDMYTAEFFIKDKAGNLKNDFTRFTIFERPKLRIDFYQMPNAFSQNNEVHGIQWKERYIPFTFGIINEGSTLTLQDIELTFNFPGVILNHIIMAKSSCVNCNIIEGQSTPSIVSGGKTKKIFLHVNWLLILKDYPQVEYLQVPYL